MSLIDHAQKAECKWLCLDCDGDVIKELATVQLVGEKMIRIVSFGYKHRKPPAKATVHDCRRLPNPHGVDHLRQRTGLDPQVKDYVRAGRAFMPLIEQAVTFCQDGALLAFGCVGGRHRSVVAAEEAAGRLRKMGHEVQVFHNELS